VAQFLDRLLNHALHLAVDADVCNGNAGFTSHSLDLFGDFLRAGLVGRDIVDADVVAVTGEAEGDGFADSAGAAGYDRGSLGG